MKKILPIVACAAMVACIQFAHAAEGSRSPVPVVSLSASATANVPNDRMYAWLRAETENADPAKAAAEVNAKMAKALARAKAVANIETATSGYSSYVVSDPKQASRWRVSQTMTLEGADFSSMAALVSKLQADDLLVLSGMSFGVSPDARRKAEDALTQQAIKSWQVRAQNAAQGFGFTGWRAGAVNIQTGDAPRPVAMIARGGAAYAMKAAPPVAVEAGDTEVTVSVSGEAVMETTPKPAVR